VRRVPVIMVAIDTITTRVSREDDSRTLPQLEHRAENLDGYARWSYTLASTVTVMSGECTIIIDTLTRND
jgi:hypothetical protein